jgi:putative translation initiation factor aIF-2 beta subunit
MYLPMTTTTAPTLFLSDLPKSQIEGWSNDGEDDNDCDDVGGDVGNSNITPELAPTTTTQKYLTMMYDDNGEDDDLELNLGMKKKKKRKMVEAVEEEKEVKDTKREEYLEMLKSLMALLYARNQAIGNVDSGGGDSNSKFKLRPPQMHTEGKRRSVFVNFMDTCKTLNRDPSHIVSFILSELGTTGSIDGTNRFVIRGRFQQKEIESILRRYIVAYVSCKNCRSLHTHFVKENRIIFMHCKKCTASRSIEPIKSGYVAKTVFN